MIKKVYDAFGMKSSYEIVEITPLPTKEKVRITNVLISWTMGIRNDMYFYNANEFRFSIASFMSRVSSIEHVAVFVVAHEQGN